MSLYFLAAALIAVALFIAWKRQEKPETDSDGIRLVMKITALDALEDLIDKSENLIRYLPYQPMTYAATFSMFVNIFMNWNFAQIVGYTFWLGMVIWGLISVFDVAVPFAEMDLDTNPNGKDTESAEGGRADFLRGVIYASVFASIVVGITNFSGIGNRNVEVSKTHNKQLEDLRAEKAENLKKISKVNSQIGAGSSKGFAKTAMEYRQKASREQGRGGCGRKCEGWKDQQIAFGNKAVKAESRENAIVRNQKIDELLNIQSGEQKSADGLVVLIEDIFGDVEDKKVMLYTLMIIVTSFMAVTPLMWKSAINKAQIARTKGMDRAMRRVYWKAAEVKNGDRWMTQRFSEEQLKKLMVDGLPENTDDATKQQVSDLTGKLDEMEKVISQPVPASHTTNIIQQPSALNQDAVNRIIHVLDVLPTNQLISSAELYKYYEKAGGMLPRGAFNTHLTQALKDRPNVHIDEKMNVKVAA